ncbi:MAG: co-chaperone GroES [Myxococcota bacterium]|nr:co-chaperone GroES [Myxococcota bacterium]
MNFRPLRDNILIKRVQAASQTASGLYIPESAKDKPQEAEVLAIGPGRRNTKGELVQMSVKVGDIVLFGKYTGKEVKLQGTEHIILRESEVLAIIER